MDKKTRELIGAAWTMFSRYGFAKTTMSDIAREAGVARQTLYNAFDSKEEVLRAVVRHAGETGFAEVGAMWSKDHDLEAKLVSFQKVGPVAWYEAMHSTPDWAELMDGVHSACGDVLRDLDVRWSAMIEEVILDHYPGTSAAKEIAQFVYSSSKNAKYGAVSLKELEARLATIRSAALALIREKQVS